jgi:hypothetical protein
MAHTIRSSDIEPQRGNNELDAVNIRVGFAVTKGQILRVNDFSVGDGPGAPTTQLIGIGLTTAIVAGDLLFAAQYSNSQGTAARPAVVRAGRWQCHIMDTSAGALGDAVYASITGVPTLTAAGALGIIGRVRSVAVLGKAILSL